MHILVTGGCGFIGSNIVEYHLEKGDEVYAVDNLSTGSLHNISSFEKNPRFHFFHEDILTWTDLKKAIDWSDRIYHMAAIVGIFRVICEPINVISNNISGCERILNLASQKVIPPLIVIASSSCVYGQSQNKIVDETSSLILPCVQHLLYGYHISKITEEGLALAYYTKFKLPIIITRLFNTIGPRQTGNYGMVVPRFIKQACNEEPITVFGNGKQSRSFCDVRDVVTFFDLLASNNEAIGEIINVGNNFEISINELAHKIKNQANSTSSITYVPYIEAYGNELLDVKRRRPNIDKLIKLTKHKPRWTIEQTISYLINQVHQQNL